MIFTILFSFFQNRQASPIEINAFLCFKVGASLEELEYIFRASRAETLSGFCGAEPAHTYVHITRRQHPKSGVRPRRGELDHCYNKRCIHCCDRCIFDRTKSIRNTREPFITKNRILLIDKLGMRFKLE